MQNVMVRTNAGTSVTKWNVVSVHGKNARMAINSSHMCRFALSNEYSFF